ncbi:hypothetical protein EPI10_024199 [Gossypium australe]|uniref:Uncharacterized protein n=1 Tax=Gossypium australe TaxID=47621 RepID=A0A5B6VY29_9ROSI|nr:hypothetical protein EPI10_024199 [Gossypium australe]
MYFLKSYLDCRRKKEVEFSIELITDTTARGIGQRFYTSKCFSLGCTGIAIVNLKKQHWRTKSIDEIDDFFDQLKGARVKDANPLRSFGLPFGLTNDAIGFMDLIKRTSNHIWTIRFCVHR